MCVCVCFACVVCRSVLLCTNGVFCVSESAKYVVQFLCMRNWRNVRVFVCVCVGVWTRMCGCVCVFVSVYLRIYVCVLDVNICV